MSGAPRGRAPDAPETPISPELALVDPELAEAARRNLPDFGFRRGSAERPEALVAPGGVRLVAPQAAPVVVRPASAATDAESRASSSPTRRSRRLGRRALLVLALYVILPVLVVGAATYATELAADQPPALLSTPAAVPPAPTNPPPRPAPSSPTPGAGTALRMSPTLVWAPVNGAAAYRFELFRREAKIYAAVTAKPQIELPLTWRYRSVRYRLEPASYFWIVRPLMPQGRKLVAGGSVVQSVWVVKAT